MINDSNSVKGVHPAPVPKDVAGLRVGVCHTINWSAAQPETISALELAVCALHDAGAVMVDAEMPPVFDGIETSFQIITTCMNGDGLDPAPGLNWWNYGYLYPPSKPPWGTTKVLPYIRHGKGGNYSWVDGHVSMTSWQVMSNGANGKIDWFYMTTPDDRPAL